MWTPSNLPSNYSTETSSESSFSPVKLTRLKCYLLLYHFPCRTDMEDSYDYEKVWKMPKIHLILQVHQVWFYHFLFVLHDQAESFY